MLQIEKDSEPILISFINKRKIQPSQIFLTQRVRVVVDVLHQRLCDHNWCVARVAGADWRED